MKKEMNVDFIFGEEWRFTPEYPNYMVSNYGRVYSYYHQKIIKPFCNTGGYLTLTLTVAKKLKRVKLSRLVAMAFHANPENKPIVHHVDCNVKNNKADNLIWVTHDEHNELHKTKPRKKDKKI